MALRFISATASLLARESTKTLSLNSCLNKHHLIVNNIKTKAIHWRCLSNQTQVVSPIEQKDESTLLLSEEDRKDFFKLNDLFTVEDLFNARVHFGHKESLLNPHMRPYIFGKRLGVLIFDLEQTAKMLKKALTVTAEIAYRNGLIMFVNRSRQTGYMVEQMAKECGEYAFCRKWRNEVLTDSHKIFGTVTRLPDLIVLFSTQDITKDTHRAVTISARMLIPTVAVCDTNSNPTLITYPVPGNDDTPQSIEYYCHLFKTAILNGKAKRTEIIEKYGEEFYYKTLDPN